MLLRRSWWIPQRGAMIANRCEHVSMVCIKETQYELIGMLRLQPVRRQSVRRKVTQVPGYNHIRSGADRCRQDVAVSRVGEIKPWYGLS